MDSSSQPSESVLFQGLPELKSFLQDGLFLPPLSIPVASPVNILCLNELPSKMPSDPICENAQEEVLLDPRPFPGNTAKADSRERNIVPSGG